MSHRRAAVARWLGIGAILYAAVMAVAYFAGGYVFVRLNGATLLFLLFGVPLVASTAGTVLYTRLPKEQQKSAFIAPLSLILLILFPAALFVLFIVALSRLGDI